MFVGFKVINLRVLQMTRDAFFMLPSQVMSWRLFGVDFIHSIEFAARACIIKTTWTANTERERERGAQSQQML